MGFNVFNKYIGELVIDQNGVKWFMVVGKGIIGVNDNGILINIVDDNFVYFIIGIGFGNFFFVNVNVLVVDQDNQFWIGIEEGFVIFYNMFFVFGMGVDVLCVLIEFEGNVEYVFGEMNVMDIVVDGVNCKWIGMDGSGVFLLSVFGQDVLVNYIMENSLLLLNQILDMDFNLVMGEFFIIIFDGLILMWIDVMQEDENYEIIIVFLNFVNLDYRGLIIIQGICVNFDVYIMDIVGNVVYKMILNGGIVIWNGKRIIGEDVILGVYVIWIVVDFVDEKVKKVGKVVVIC